MSILDNIRVIKSNLSGSFSNRESLKTFSEKLIPIGTPLTLAVFMGVLLAIFIVNSKWALVFGLLLLVPAIVLFLRYPFSVILIWLLVIPFLQTTINPAFRTAFWLIHRAMPVIALIGYFVYSKKFNSIKRRSFPKPGPAEFAMAVFLAITIANVYLFQSNPLPYIILVYDRIFIPMCLYILVRVIEPRQNDLERILPIAMFLIMIESLIGILSQTAPHLVPAEWAFHQGERAVGTFTSAHGYTMSMVFFILLLYHGAMQRKSGIVRTIYLIGVAFGVMGILLSFTRGSWLGAIVVGVGLIILYPKNTLRFAGLLVTFMAILGMTIFSDQVDFALDRIDSEDTALDRLVIWDAGRQMIEKKPLFGWGYGDYSLYAPQFQQRIQNYIAANPHASHNSLITIAAELGIPALLAFLFPFLWWLILSPTVWSKIPKSGFWSQPLLAVLWLVILDIFIETTFTDIRHSTYNQGIWWITLALIANMIYSYKSTNDLKILVRRVKK